MTQRSSQQEYVIGIDAGGTHTRVGCFALDGTPLAAAVGGGGAPHHNDDALENIHGTIAEALRDGGLDPAGAVALAAGIAGVVRTGSNQDGGDNTRTAALVDVPGLDCPKVVVNDAVIAHRGALSGRPGIVVVAGTGSMILAIDGDGVETESGQLEHYAGAARHLVHDVVQQILMGDCSPTDPLLAATLEHFGAVDVPALHEAVLARSSTHRNTAKRIYGDFAPQVTTLAERSALADRALTDLAARTARGVRLLASSAGPHPVPVACTGSLADAPSFHDRLEHLLREAAPSTLDLVPSRLEPLGGAAVLALEVAAGPVDEPIIQRLAARRDDGRGAAATPLRHQARPMLLLVDLDNTLVDRDGAFSTWAAEFVTAHGGSEEDLRWLLDTDDHGYAPRAILADGLLERLDLAATRDELIQTLLHGHAGSVRCYDGLLEKLAEMRAQGWTLVVLTNGLVDQQTRKVQVSGLEAHVDRVVISEAVGAKKPDAEIFTAALDGFPSDAAPWMVGDRASADIHGGQTAGCRTGWVSHGRAWEHGEPPTLQAPSTLDVLDLILTSETTR